MTNPEVNGAVEFADFVLAYQDTVFSTAARLLGNDAQAEDVTQEVFLKAYEQFERLRSSPTRGGWLKTVATNRCLNHLARHRKRWRLFSELAADRGGEDAAEFDFPVPDTLLEDLAADARASRVERALQALPDHQRVPLVLYHFEELSYADIASRLSVSLPKVKIDILRGRAALARTLAADAPAAGAAP